MYSQSWAHLICLITPQQSGSEGKERAGLSDEELDYDDGCVICKDSGFHLVTSSIRSSNNNN